MVFANLSFFCAGVKGSLYSQNSWLYTPSFIQNKNSDSLIGFPDGEEYFIGEWEKQPAALYTNSWASEEQSLDASQQHPSMENFENGRLWLTVVCLSSMWPRTGRLRTGFTLLFQARTSGLDP